MAPQHGIDCAADVRSVGRISSDCANRALFRAAQACAPQVTADYKETRQTNEYKKRGAPARERTPLERKEEAIPRAHKKFAPPSALQSPHHNIAQISHHFHIISIAICNSFTLLTETIGTYKTRNTELANKQNNPLYPPGISHKESGVLRKLTEKYCKQKQL